MTYLVYKHYLQDRKDISPDTLIIMLICMLFAGVIDGLILIGIIIITLIKTGMI